MAPKSAAKKAAAPPPPPPLPAESSSDETRSGSRSRSDESEDEEAIADSPVPAATPALKNAPAPSQKGAESESSEEESDEEEEEEEEEPARAAPKTQPPPPPPPPQKKVDSDASGSDDDDDEEEDDEEEEEEEKKEEPAPKKQPPPAPKKQAPPAPKKSEESDASDEEEEEDEEEEAPPPKPVPKKDLKPPPKPVPKKDLKPPPAAVKTKKPGGIQRIWSTDDEVRILEALAAHQKQHGTLLQPEALLDVLNGKLDNPAYGIKELHSKVRALKTRYLTLSKRGELPSKEHDRRLLDLSKMVWDSNKTSPVAAAAAAAANGHGRKGFEEMCELYPYLAEEVKELEAVHPGLCKREFGKMDDDKARAMDDKIKRQRVAQIRLEMRRSDLAKEVAKALVDLLDV